MLYEETTEEIIGACFEVYNELGSGFLETVYEKALLIALTDRGLHASAQVPVNVIFRNKIIGDYIADIIVENKVIVELKSISNLRKEHEAQIIHYLKATGLKVGLLINFGSQKLEWKRFVF